MSDLHDKAQAMQYYLDEALRRFNRGGTPEEIAENSLEISDEYRILALYSKLLADDDNAFCEQLSRGARDWLSYLLRIFGGLPARRRDYCLSKKNPFLAAVAAGDTCAATLISLFTPKQYEKEWEDLDDFLYALFLHQMILRSQEDERLIGQVLCDYTSEAIPVDSVRPALCAALFARDATAFNAAMDDLVLEHEREIEKENVARNKLPMEFAVTRELFLEGIALVNIARYLGMSVVDEYRFIPTVNRSLVENQFSVDVGLTLTAKEKPRIAQRFSTIENFKPYFSIFETYMAQDA